MHTCITIADYNRLDITKGINMNRINTYNMYTESYLRRVINNILIKSILG